LCGRLLDDQLLDAGAERELGAFLSKTLTPEQPGGRIVAMGALGGQNREQVVRWLDEGQRQLPALVGLVHENERLRERLDISQSECEKLRGLVYEVEQLRNRSEAAERVGERLREQLSGAEAELERQTRDQTELAEHLTNLVNDVLVRLRPRSSVAEAA
jgi:chromosome segregation ATPase